MAVTIIKQPSSVTAIVGTTAKFAVLAEGNINGYNWQIRKPTDTSWAGTTMTGSKTPVLEVPAAESRNGYMYRCIIYDTDGNSVISDVVTLTVIDVGFINRSTLTAIADAIRAKTETTDKILPADMAGMIEGFVGLPDGISELEVVTCAGSGTTSQSIPCNLSGTPACVVLYSTVLETGTQKITAIMWAYDYELIWYSTSSCAMIGLSDPLIDGEINFQTSSSSQRFLGEYRCVMWR